MIYMLMQHGNRDEAIHKDRFALSCHNERIEYEKIFSPVIFTIEYLTRYTYGILLAEVKGMCEYELDARKLIEGYNKAVDINKIGFELMFPETPGSVVRIQCRYVRTGDSQYGKTVLVNKVINLANPMIYADKNDDISHMWLQGIFDETNPQRQLWESLQENDTLCLQGTVVYYESQNTYKIGLKYPVILRAERDRDVIFSM